MQDLKPCPFCGVVPDLTITPGSYGYTHDKIGISCCNGISIGANMQKWEIGRGHYDVSQEAKKTVIDRWNKRAV